MILTLLPARRIVVKKTMGIDVPWKAEDEQALQDALAEPVDENKYITFKRSEFYEMMGKLALPPYYGETETGRKERAGAHWNCAPIAEEIQRTAEVTALDDAVVIRRRDVFAAPALEAYCNAITCVIDAVRIYAIDLPHEVQRLIDIADYFHDQAEKAYTNGNRKLPD